MIEATLGWIGTIGMFAAYVLADRKILRVDSMSYALLNTTGGLLGGFACVLYQAWPSAVNNLAWGVIGLVCLRRNRIAQRAPSAGLAGDHPDSLPAPEPATAVLAVGAR